MLDSSVTTAEISVAAPARGDAAAVGDSPPDKSHLPILDALRGIAALAVCWFHYSTAQFTDRFPVYRSTGRYGYLGVQVFFVISGFIIPWSLFRVNYRLASFFRFLARRIIRLDPPYLASVVIVVSGYFLSSMILDSDRLYRIPWTQLFAHVGYLNAFLGMPWLQQSYWSLAVEFQYYIFIGLTFVLYTRKGAFWLVLIPVLFAAASLTLGRDPAFLPHHLPLFLLGIVAFRYKCLDAGRSELLLGIVLAAALAWRVDGWREMAAGSAACAAILFIHSSTPILNFLGAISYSLYLIHIFIGDIVLGLVARRAGDLGVLKWIVPLFAVGVAIGAAYLMYRLIELPSKRWSARIRYGSRAPVISAGRAVAR